MKQDAKTNSLLSSRRGVLKGGGLGVLALTSTASLGATAIGKEDRPPAGTKTSPSFRKINFQK